MNKIIIFFGLLFILNACQSTKDAFTLKKNNSADEFLVEKKSPLVLPPDYGKLPQPDSKQSNQSQKDEVDIKTLLSDDKNLTSKEDKNLKPSSIEDTVLNKIK